MHSVNKPATIREQNFFKSNIFGLIVVLIALMVFFSVSSEYFFVAGNLFTITGQMVELGLLTLGMSMALFSGGFDLSIASVGSFTSVLLAVFINHMGMGIYPSMLIALVIVLGIGFFNGFLIGYLRIEPMLATLGMQGLVAGLTLGIAKGEVIQILNPEFFFGKLKVGGHVPFQFFIFIIMVLVAVVLANYTRWGRRVYMIGSNREVAAYAGINVPKTIMMVYVYSAIHAFLAGVIIASRLESGKSQVLDALVLQTVTAAVFGGVSIYGGKGNIIGAVIGVVTFSVISNGLNMMGVSQYAKQVVIGAVLLVVLAFNIWRERRSLTLGR